MTASGRVGRIGGLVMAVTVLAFTLGSCQAVKNQMQMDRPAEMDVQDYRDALAPVPPPLAELTPAPEFQPVLSTPAELRLPSPLVTVEVNQTVGLRDLIWQLAQQADVDLELDPQIRGSVVFTAKERPFDEVVQRLSEMTGLRYKFENNVLRVELDRPYVRNYTVDFLNVSRKGDTKISVASSSSSGSVSGTMEGDLWKELNDGLEQVLTSSDTTVFLATLSDPVAAPVNPSPPPLPVATDPNAPPPPPPAPGSPQVAPMPAVAAPTINITTPPAEPLVPNPPATFSISQQSGTVSVFASDRQQRLVQRFLDDFRKRVSTQVLIEAKVLQVDLEDDYAMGIDWQSFNVTGLAAIAQSFPQPTLDPALPVTAISNIAFRPGSDFNTVISAISRFGAVRALSSPRVTVMNNQPAIVNVVRDNVYFDFEVSVTPATDTAPALITIDSDQKNAPEGIVLTVTPLANPDTGEIVMAVRPTISRKVGAGRADPTVGLTLAVNQVDLGDVEVPENIIPELSVQEVDSVLRMQSGQMMALGGLMRDENSAEKIGLPVVKDIPVVGSLFSSHRDRVRKTELVILIRASVVSGSNIDDTERRIYKAFSLDRRPGPL